MTSRAAIYILITDPKPQEPNLGSSAISRGRALKTECYLRKKVDE